MYNVHFAINVPRVSSRKIALIFVILISDDNLRIFCIREFPIRRREKFLHLTPVYLRYNRSSLVQTRKLLSSSSPGTHQCPSTDLARLIMLDVIKIRVSANCAVNIIDSNLIFSSHSLYFLLPDKRRFLNRQTFQY